MASLTKWTWAWVNSGSWWWTGRPRVLQFMGSQRVRDDWATEMNWTEYSPTVRCFFFFPQARLLFGEGNGTSLQYSCLENPMDGGAWWAAVYGVAKSQTRLSGFTSTFHFHALEKEMATHSSVLAWRIPGMGSLVAAIFGVTQSQTRLKQLSSSSSSRLLLTEFDRLRNWNSETFSNWCNVSELLKEEPGVQSGTSDPCSFSCPELQLSTVRAELQDSRFTLHAFTFIQINPSVFLPGESQGQGSMVGCHLWGRTESDTIEAT